MITCPFHGNHQENHPSCGIYVGNDSSKYGLFHCFTCGRKGYITELIQDIFDFSISECKEWLKEYLIDSLEDVYLPDSIQIPTTTLKNSSRFLDPKCLEDYKYIHPYLVERHIDPNIIKMFTVGYDFSTKSITFPVWDEFNNLVSITRRSILRKQFSLPANQNKYIYLLNFILKWHIDTVIVTESQINCLTCFSWHLPAVALFGTGSYEQYNILRKVGIRNYILCFDGDLAGHKGAERFIKNLSNDCFITNVVMPEGKDINDLTKEYFFQLLEYNSVDPRDLSSNLENIWKQNSIVDF